MSTAGFRKRCKCQFVPLHAEARDSLINPWKIQFIQRLGGSVLGLIGELLAEMLQLAAQIPISPLMLLSQDSNKPWLWEEVLPCPEELLQEATEEAALLQPACDCSRSPAGSSRSIDHSRLGLCVWRVCVREKKREGERVISHRSKCFFALL